MFCTIFNFQTRSSADVCGENRLQMSGMNFGLYVSGFWHIHAKTSCGIVVCEQ